MFCLLQFDNLEYSILPTKRVKIVEGKNCIVKYTSGAKYNAELIETSDSKTYLDDLKNGMKKPQTKLVSSTPNKSSELNLTFTFHKNYESPDLNTSKKNFLQNASEGSGSEIVTEMSTRNEVINNTTNIIASESNASENTEKLNLEINGEQNSSEIVTRTDSHMENNTTNVEESCSNYEPSSLNEVSKSIEKFARQEIPSRVEATHRVNIQELEILPSNSQQIKSKKHFCPYCKTLQTKFARHLVIKHKNEEKVKQFLYLPNKSKERHQLIDKIRKKGDFLHNTDAEFNSGILIVSRQKQLNSEKKAVDYICCHSCKGFFSKQTIRFHTAKCDKNRKKGEKGILSAGRRCTGYIHSFANENLRNNIFPVFCDDEIIRTIQYDELIILYGNKLSERYTLRHQHDYVRAQLRMLGRIKLEMMKIDKSIIQFKDIFKPQYFDKCVECLRTLAQWDVNSGRFGIPFNAQFISTLIKKCGKKLRTECIKCEDYSRKEMVENFLLLWEEEVPVVINKKAQNDQMDLRRDKRTTLPSKDDIKKLYEYLKKESMNCLQVLDKNWNFDAYKLLKKTTLVLIQIFNRRRAGEIERLSLINYNNKEALGDNLDSDLYKEMSESIKEATKQFTRIVIRGKLGRTVPVLLSPLAVKCIEKIIECRDKAGVPSSNQFIFSSNTSNKLSKPYIRACPLLRQFSNECGAVMPSSLRGTHLRKHVATYISMLNVEECQVDRLANFMGHNKDIHKSIYRVPVPVAEITHVSKLLMAAIGEEGNEGEEANSDANSDSSDEEEHCVQRSRDVSLDINNSLNKSPSTSSPQNNDVEFSKLSSTITRRKWSELEKRDVSRYFGDLKMLPKLPSLKECSQAMKNCKSLSNRTPHQIFAYINNQRRRI